MELLLSKPMSDRIFEHDGISFRYRDEGSGLPFVWQHGLGSDLTVNFDLLPPPVGTRMLGMDARGHGETRPLGPVELLSIPQTVEDIKAWLDAIGIKKAVMGGISMGAAIALRFTQLYPDRVVGLILSRPAWLDQPRPENLRVFETIADLIRQCDPALGQRRFLETPEYAEHLRTSPDAAQILAGQFVHPRAAETFEKYEHIVNSCPWPDRLAWKAIDVPTLVLGNHADPLHPFQMAEELHSLIPGSKVVEITAKSVSLSQHAHDVRKAVDGFFDLHRSCFESTL